MNDNDRRLRQLIQTGSEIAGNLTSAAVTALLANPAGLVAGAALGPVVSRIGGEIIQWAMSGRERSRVGATYAVSITRINERVGNGDPLSSEFFAMSAGESRSTAEELLEGVLRAAQLEHQEQKVAHYGFLLANLAFASGVSRDTANHLLTLAQTLTYRQLCLLSMYQSGALDRDSVPPEERIDVGFGTVRSVRDPRTLLWTPLPPTEDVSLDDVRPDIVTDLRDLQRRGLLLPWDQNIAAWSVVKKAHLSPLGDRFADFAELSRIPTLTIEAQATALGLSGR